MDETVQRDSLQNNTITFENEQINSGCANSNVLSPTKENDFNSFDDDLERNNNHISLIEDLESNNGNVSPHDTTLKFFQDQSFFKEKPPLIIDNGADQLRAKFNQTQPSKETKSTIRTNTAQDGVAKNKKHTPRY